MKVKLHAFRVEWIETRIVDVGNEEEIENAIKEVYHGDLKELRDNGVIIEWEVEE